MSLAPIHMMLDSSRFECKAWWSLAFSWICMGIYLWIDFYGFIDEHYKVILAICSMLGFLMQLLFNLINTWQMVYRNKDRRRNK